MKKPSEDSKQKSINKDGKINKRVDKIPQELKGIMIDTSKSSEKKSSTKILNELRNGAK